MTRDKTILVIGGAGFIGSHTVLALKAAGYGVVVYDNFSTGHRDAAFGDALVEGDLSDQTLLEQTIRAHDIAGVVHFAALIEAGQSVIDPWPFFRNNVAATLSLLQAMQATGLTRIVFSSTAAVYGDAGDRGGQMDGVTGGLTEDLPKAPVNPYGSSKAMVEDMLAAGVGPYGLKAIALRYFNAAGADPEGRTGERHTPETHLIPLVIQAALGQREAIRVFGTDYPTPDGTCIRDYIHVTDLAAGHVAALNALFDQERPGFQALNLGTGQGLSVREIIEAVRRVSGRDFAVIEEDRRPGDPAHLVANPQAARACLGWQAKESGIDQIVGDAFAYFSAQA